MENEIELLTTQEAARILRVTPQTIMNMIRRGDLPGRKIGMGNNSPWRIPRESVLKYINFDEEKSSVKAST